MLTTAKLTLYVTRRWRGKLHMSTRTGAGGKGAEAKVELETARKATLSAEKCGERIIYSG